MSRAFVTATLYRPAPAHATQTQRDAVRRDARAHLQRRSCASPISRLSTCARHTPARPPARLPARPPSHLPVCPAGRTFAHTRVCARSNSRD